MSLLSFLLVGQAGHHVATGRALVVLVRMPWYQCWCQHWITYTGTDAINIVVEDHTCTSK